jgi:hypothetical protein
MDQDARQRLMEKLKLELLDNAKYKAWERAKAREESYYWTSQTENEETTTDRTNDTTESVKPENVESESQEKHDNADKQTQKEIKYARALKDVNPQTEDELPLRKGDMLVVLERHSKEGWWKGQLGSKVGYFPENAIEFVSEQEVLKFLESASVDLAQKKKVQQKVPQRTKQELVAEMNQLQKDLKDTQQKLKVIEQEIEELRTQQHKLQKKYKENSSQFSCSYYGINPIQMFYFDILKLVRLLEEDNYKEKEVRPVVDKLIEHISNFVSDFKKECTTDSKLKTHAEKIISKLQSYQNLLINRRANFDDQNSNEFYNLLFEFCQRLGQECNKPTTQSSTATVTATNPVTTTNPTASTSTTASTTTTTTNTDKNQNSKESEMKSTYKKETQKKKEETKLKDTSPSDADTDKEKNSETAAKNTKASKKEYKSQ